MFFVGFLFFHSVIFLHLITLSLFSLCIEQPSRITTRLSVSQPLWPGLPTSCRCGGRSWAWWEPSLSRSLFRSCSSVHCGGSDLELFTCRWKEIHFFMFCFSFTCSIINFSVGSKMKSVCFLSSSRCCFKSSSFCLATTTSSTCWPWPSVCHFLMIVMSISGCARHTRPRTGMMVWNWTLHSCSPGAVCHEECTFCFISSSFRLKEILSTNFARSLSPLYLDSKLWPWLCYLLELVVWALLIVGTIICFDLQLDTAKKGISSRTGECFVFSFYVPLTNFASLFSCFLKYPWQHLHTTSLTCFWRPSLFPVSGSVSSHSPGRWLPLSSGKIDL